MDRLLLVNPKEVHFTFEVGKKAFAKVEVVNLMHAMPVAFKVLTTAPSKYGVRPTRAIIPPGAVSYFEVVMIAPQSLSESILFAEDKFFVQSMLFPTGKATSDELKHSFSIMKRNVLTDASLRVVYTGNQFLRYLVATESVESLKYVQGALEGHNVNEDDKEGCTALHLAAVNGNYRMVNKLISAGANVNVKTKMGLTPLLEASSRGYCDIVTILLKAGADITAANSKGRTVLHVVASLDYVEVVRVLLEGGANIHAKNDQGMNPLHEAAVAGNLNSVRLLLQSGVDTERRSTDGSTALHCAAAHGHIDVVSLLLDEGANVNAKNNEVKTPYDLSVRNDRQSRLLGALQFQEMLQKAARANKTADVSKYILLGASLDGQDKHGWTPLHRASFKGHLESVRALVKHGANVNCKDYEGYSPLHCAVETGHRDVVQYLLQHGADSSQINDRGLTPLVMAMEMKKLSIERLMLATRTEVTWKGKLR